ncbi:unnamed protein product [Ciceribacter sp. T2.26MG-112.2]|nr:unnamed protein product [Ciceribacter naphthalenivorans]
MFRSRGAIHSRLPIVVLRRDGPGLMLRTILLANCRGREV